MKNDLELKIGTKYDGDGMKKLDGALKNTAKSVGSASRALGSISGELGQMGGKAGQAASAVSGLFSSFLAGGPIAGIVAGITAAVGLLVKAFNDAKQSAEEAADTIRDSFAKSLEAVEHKLSGLLKLFGLAKKEASINASAAAKETDQATRTQIAAIQNKAADDRAKETNDFNKQRITAKETKDIALAQIDASVKKAKESADALKEQLSLVNGEVSTIEKKLGDKTQELSVQAATTVDDSVKAKYEQLKKNVADWAKAAAEKGKDAVAYTTTTRVATGSQSITGGPTSYQDIEVATTYEQAMEQAAKALNEYKKEHKKAIKHIEAYTANQKQLEELDDKLKNAKLDQMKALKDSKAADKEIEVVQKEAATKRKKAEEDYQKQMENIAKQEQAQIDKAMNEAMSELDKMEKEFEEYGKEMKKLSDKETQNQIKQTNKERQKGMEDYNKELKDLTDEITQTKKDLNEAGEGMKSLAQRAKEAVAGWANNLNGGGFTDWDRDRRRGEAAKDKAARNAAKNDAGAEAHQKNIGERVFDRNGNVRLGANVQDIGGFARLTDYRGGKGMTDAQKQGLQDKADKLKEKLFEKDGKTLKRGKERTAEYSAYKNIKGLLDKMKDVKDADDKKTKLAELEKKKQELEQRRVQWLQGIDTKLGILNDKLGI